MFDSPIGGGHPAGDAASPCRQATQPPRPALQQEILGALEASPWVAPLWRATKDALKRPIVLRAYRQRLQRQQHRAFDELIARARGSTPYSEAHTRASLARKAHSRLPFCGRDGRPNVVAFGFENWEKAGFWPSMERTCNFRFMSLGELSRQRGEAGRRALAEACLRRVDAVRETLPISAAFFYIDSASLPRALFEGLRARGIWSVLLCLDDKHRLAARWEHGVWTGGGTLVPHVDLYWTIWRTGAQVIQNMGGTAWYAAPGADPTYHHPIAAERDLDVLFLGQNYGDRGALVSFLRARGIHVHAVGPGWTRGFVTFDETLRLYGRARLVLGHSATGCMPDVTALKGRDFEAPMCGTVYVTSYNPELADFYAIGQEIFCYTTPRDCSDLVQWLLSNPDRQADVRRAARARALHDHTWESRFSALFSLFPPES
jgi:spore maturation protein CgeB